MPPPKKRLGRGLGSLITGGISKSAPAKTKKASRPAKKKTATKKKAAKKSPPKKKTARPAKKAAKPADKLPDADGYMEVPISRIEPNPYQPRREMDAAHISELAESIRSEGLLQPIVVRRAGDTFQLIAGERRYRACQELKLKSIPARVIEASDASSATMSLIENLQREGLNPIEEAHGYASLIRDFDLTQEAVSERVGKGRATVANALRLLQLDREIQGYLSKGLLSVGHAKVILGIEEPDQRQIIARRIVESGMSVRELERVIKRFRDGTKSTARGQRPGAESNAIHEVEQQLAGYFKTRVQLKHTPKKGRIIIEYYGNDDLQRILEEMGMNT